jgi:hypothetical protein
VSQRWIIYASTVIALVAAVSLVWYLVADATA